MEPIATNLKSIVKGQERRLPVDARVSTGRNGRATLPAPGPIPGVSVPSLGVDLGDIGTSRHRLAKKRSRPVPISTNLGQSGGASASFRTLRSPDDRSSLIPASLAPSNQWAPASTALTTSGPGRSRLISSTKIPALSEPLSETGSKVRAGRGSSVSRRARRTRRSVGRPPSPGNGGCSESLRRTTERPTLVERCREIGTRPTVQRPGPVPGAGPSCRR